MGTPGLRSRALDVDALEQLAAPGCELRMAGTLPVTAQSPSATSTWLRWRIVCSLLQVVLDADRAFDQRDVHALGKLLRVHQRAVDQVDLAAASAMMASSMSSSDMWQPEQPSSQHGRQLAPSSYLPPRLARQAADVAGRASPSPPPPQPFSASAPVGQACTHLPQLVQLARLAPGLVQLADQHASWMPRAADVPHVRAFDFGADAHAARAQDAAVVVEHEARMRRVHRQAAG